MANAWEQFSKGFGDAVADIREKAYEEPYFGRVVTERESAVPQWPESQPDKSFGSLSHEKEVAPDLDIDR